MRADDKKVLVLGYIPSAIFESQVADDEFASWTVIIVLLSGWQECANARTRLPRPFP